MRRTSSISLLGITLCVLLPFSGSVSLGGSGSSGSTGSTGSTGSHGRVLSFFGAARAQEDSRRGQPIVGFEGGSISVGDVEDAIANRTRYLRRPFVSTEGRTQLLREMVDYELLVAEARRRGYAEHPRVREAMLRRSVVELKIEVMAPFTVESIPAQDVAAYHVEHLDELLVRGLRRASYVRFDSRDEAVDFRKSAAKMGVDEFRRLAVRMDPKGRGGELGYVDSDGRPGGDPGAEPLDAELTRMAYSLAKIGDLSEPAAFQGGFVVLRLTGLTPEHGRELSDVEGDIREQLAVERADAAVEALYARLRTETPPELKRALLERVRIDDPGPLDIPSGHPAAPPDPTAPTIVVEPDGA